MNGPVQNDGEAWREYLAALPEADPPERLWLRLRQAQAAKPAARAAGWRPRHALAASLMLLVAAGAAWQLRDVPAGATAPLAAQPVPAAVDAGVRQLDDELALAYSRNAAEAELAALWEARERLLDSFDPAAPALVARM